MHARENELRKRRAGLAALSVRFADWPAKRKKLIKIKIFVVVAPQRPLLAFVFQLSEN